MRYLDFFDDVYYINLDSRVDRKEKFIQRAEEVGIINPNRLSAFQPSFEECEKVPIPFWPEDGTDEEKRLKANEFGTALSHTEIIKIAKERKLGNVFIFEDDCLFLDGFKEEVQKCIDDLKNIEWDVIFFGGAPNDYPERITDNISSLKVGGVYGIHCYAVNHTFYDTIIKLTNNFHICSVMDITLLHLGHNLTTNKNRIYIVSKKLLAIQETNFSDLRNQIVETSHFVREWDRYVTNPDPELMKQTRTKDRVTEEIKSAYTVYQVINFLIRKYNFNRYLEINTYGNISNINANIKNSIKQKKSNDFFIQNQDKIDIIFIDGEHNTEQDFRNITDALKHLSENGIIVVHDCNPIKEYHASVSNNGGSWLGETYKAYIDAAYTYELDHFTIDSDWGCGVIMPNKTINFEVERKRIVKDWNFFNTNKKDLLNLIEPEEFISFIENDTVINSSLKNI